MRLIRQSLYITLINIDACGNMQPTNIISSYFSNNQSVERLVWHLSREPLKEMSFFGKKKTNSNV